MHVAGDAKKGTDVREVLALRPFADLGDLGVVWDAAFVGALVSEDGDFWPCDGELLGGNGGSGAEEAVEDAMDIVDVHPNELADLWVSWNHLVPSVLSFETGLGVKVQGLKGATCTSCTNGSSVCTMDSPLKGLGKGSAHL